MKNSIIIYDTYRGETDFPKDADVALITHHSQIIWFPAARVTRRQRLHRFYHSMLIRLMGFYRTYFDDGSIP